MDTKPIERYTVTEEGYHPFLIQDGWQVAQLNYMEAQDIQNIHRLDVHHHTDEVFVLLQGDAVLIGAVLHGDVPTFSVERMQPKITYNIPKDSWHNIAMRPGSEVLIVEKSNTHVSDFEFFPLTLEKRKELRDLVEQALTENIE
ncbi:MAG: hypothetical protein AAGA86_01700 [Bacteroidota bacterium]